VSFKSGFESRERSARKGPMTEGARTTTWN